MIKKYGLNIIGTWYCHEKIGNLIGANTKLLKERGDLKLFPLAYSNMYILSDSVRRTTEYIKTASIQLGPIGYIWINAKTLKVVRCTSRNQIEKNVKKLEQLFKTKFNKKRVKK